MITNKAGDKIFVSNDGARRLQFHVKDPHPHNNPHVHVGHLTNQGRLRGKQVYPKNVLPK